MNRAAISREDDWLRFSTQTPQYRVFIKSCLTVHNCHQETDTTVKETQTEYIDLNKSLSPRGKKFIQSDSINNIFKYSQLFTTNKIDNLFTANKFDNLFTTNKIDNLFTISYLKQEYSILNNYLSCIQSSGHSIANSNNGNEDKTIIPVIVDSLILIY